MIGLASAPRSSGRLPRSATKLAGSLSSSQSVLPAEPLQPAVWPRPGHQERLLILAGERLAAGELTQLACELRAGDLLVVNDAATLPASLPASDEDGARLELRLAGQRAGGDSSWDVVLLGPGSWRTPTERRPQPPALEVGDLLYLPNRDEPQLVARVSALGPTPRRARLSFLGDAPAFWRAVYALGRPIQYSYLADDLSLGQVQTPYAGRPWAVEPPSAGRPLSWGTLLACRRRGVQLARLTHAAGLSSSGDPATDAALPLPERYEIPPETAAAWAATRTRGGRVLAVGTTVVRALESAVRAAPDGRVQAGGAVTDFKLGPATSLRAVDGLLSGLHEPDSSHFALLQAFAPRERLLEALRRAHQGGYLGHEFGDGLLVWRDGLERS